MSSSVPLCLYVRDRLIRTRLLKRLASREFSLVPSHLSSLYTPSLSPSSSSSSSSPPPRPNPPSACSPPVGGSGALDTIAGARQYRNTSPIRPLKLRISFNVSRKLTKKRPRFFILPSKLPACFQQRCENQDRATVFVAHSTHCIGHSEGRGCNTCTRTVRSFRS